MGERNGKWIKVKHISIGNSLLARKYVVVTNFKTSFNKGKV